MYPRFLALTALAGGLLAAPARAQDQQTIPLNVTDQYGAGKAANVSLGAGPSLTLSPVLNLSPAWTLQPNQLPQGGVSGHALLSGNKTYLVNGQEVRRLYVIGGRRGGVLLNDVLTATLDANGNVSAFTPSGNVLPLPRGFHTAVLYNNTIYVVGGDVSASGRIDDLVVTDTVLMSKLDSEGMPGPWVETTKLPLPRDSMAVAAEKGTLYAAGGAPPGDFLVGTQNTWYAPIKGDGSLGEWKELVLTDPMSFPQRYGAGAFVLGNDLWVIGGADYDFSGNRTVTLNDVRSSALGTDNAPGPWIAEQPLPIDLGNIHNSTVIGGGRIYTLGGLRNGAPTPAVTTAGVSAAGRPQNWTPTLEALPVALNDPAATYLNGTLIEAGGRDTAFTDRREVYVNRLIPADPAAFASFGTFESPILDLATLQTVVSFGFTVTPTNPAAAGTVQVQARVARDDGVFTAWTPVASTSPISINQPARYFQYRIVLSSTEAAQTPQVSALSLTTSGITLIYGDVSLDGTVNVFDAIVALRAAVGLETLSSQQIQAGDVAPKPGADRPFGDGVVNVLDAVRILRSIVNLDTLP